VPSQVNMNSEMREGDKDTKGIKEGKERTKDEGTEDLITRWISAGLLH
jgi:hypothetical protein